MKLIIYIKTLVLFVILTSCNTNSSKLEFSEKEKQEIIKRETQTWEYSKTKDLEKLEEILADDYIGYFGRATMNENDVIQSLGKTKLVSYKLMDFRVKPITNEVAVIYYLANQDGIGADGTPWVPDVAAAATYVKRNGKWYSVFYQETVLEK